CSSTTIGCRQPKARIEAATASTAASLRRGLFGYGRTEWRGRCLTRMARRPFRRGGRPGGGPGGAGAPQRGGAVGPWKGGGWRGAGEVNGDAHRPAGWVGGRVGVQTAPGGDVISRRPEATRGLHRGRARRRRGASIRREKPGHRSARSSSRGTL